MKLNTRDKQVIWFVKNYKKLVNELNDLHHYSVIRNEHPYHTESSVWAHTMMVMTYIDCVLEESDKKQILLTVGLLHDLGKIEAFETVDDKYTFKGHEGISVLKAIDILYAMKKMMISMITKQRF